MNEQQPSQLPASMRYGKSKNMSVEASTTERQFSASNGAVFDENTNEIRIPVSSHDGFLDSTESILSFTITNTSTVGTEKFTLCSDVACCIEQLRIESGGTILESIDRYNLYHNHKMLWASSMANLNQRAGMGGGPEDGHNTGSEIDIGAANAFTGCIKLQSGFLQSHGYKAIPMGVQFEIVLRLASGQSAFKNADNVASKYTVSNVKWLCPMYRIENPEVMSDYMQVINSTPISISGQTAKSYISPISAGTGVKTAQLNDRSLSLLGVASILRATATAAANVNSLEGALTGVSSYVYNFDGQKYPSSDVKYSALDCGRAYSQLAKLYTNDWSGTVKRSNFVSLTGGQSQGSVAVVLKKFSDDELKMVGLNTARNASPSTVELDCPVDPGASELISYAICEAVYTRLPNGSLQVSN